MRFSIIGVRQGQRITLGRGVSTLDLGGILLSNCLLYDHFEVAVDPDYEVAHERS